MVNGNLSYNNNQSLPLMHKVKCIVHVHEQYHQAQWCQRSVKALTVSALVYSPPTSMSVCRLIGEEHCISYKSVMSVSISFINSSKNKCTFTMRVNGLSTSNKLGLSVIHICKNQTHTHWHMLSHTANLTQCYACTCQDLSAIWL